MLAIGDRSSSERVELSRISRIRSCTYLTDGVRERVKKMRKKRVDEQNERK